MVHRPVGIVNEVVHNTFNRLKGDFLRHAGGSDPPCLLSHRSLMIESWEKANRIRAFMAEVRLYFERTKGPIEEGSELARWMEWALDHADRIDPLGRKSQGETGHESVSDAPIPHKPR